MKMADMHVHSHYSDGYDSPREIVMQAKQAGLAAVCLADHDTYQGIPEFLAALEEFEMSGIPAIEITTFGNRVTAHILGYGIDPSRTEELENAVRVNWQVHNDRVVKALDKLRLANIMDVSLEQFRQTAGYRGPCALKLWLRHYREHICGLTHEQAVAETRKGGIAHVEYDREALMSTIAAIKLIVSLDGLPILAHPGEIMKKMALGDFCLLFDKLQCAGLAGLEAFHTSNTEAQTQFLIKLATAKKLLITGGSDFHGRFHPARKIGMHGTTWEHFSQVKSQLKS